MASDANKRTWLAGNQEAHDAVKPGLNDAVNENCLLETTALTM